MFLTVHAAAAIIIGKKIHSSFWAFILSLLSHFILDIIPHGDKKMGIKFLGFRFGEKEEAAGFKTFMLYGFFDVLILLVFILYLFRNFTFANTDSVAWAILAAIVPDVLILIYKVKKIKCLSWYADFHKKNHALILNKMKDDIPLKWGMLSQMILFIIFFWIMVII